MIAGICVEMLDGRAPLTHTAWPSVPEVHAVGFLSGLLPSVIMAFTGVVFRNAAAVGWQHKP